jgi:hypothetical protein
MEAVTTPLPVAMVTATGMAVTTPLPVAMVMATVVTIHPRHIDNRKVLYVGTATS